MTMDSDVYELLDATTRRAEAPSWDPDTVVQRATRLRRRRRATYGVAVAVLAMAVTPVAVAGLGHGASPVDVTTSPTPPAPTTSPPAPTHHSAPDGTCAPGQLRVDDVTWSVGGSTLGSVSNYDVVTVTNLGDRCRVGFPGVVEVASDSTGWQTVPAANAQVASTYSLGPGPNEVTLGAYWPIRPLPSSLKHSWACDSLIDDVSQVRVVLGRAPIVVELPKTWDQVCASGRAWVSLQIGEDDGIDPDSIR